MDEVEVEMKDTYVKVVMYEEDSGHMLLEYQVHGSTVDEVMVRVLHSVVV